MAKASDQSCTGSDMDFPCTPCAEDGNTESAAKYCSVCNEYLCVTCVKYHTKFTATRDHVLVDRDEAMSLCGMKRKGRKVACRLHPSSEITSFCKTHDAVFCSLCAATEHRQCQSVSSIKEATSTQQSIDLRLLQQDVRRCLADLDNIKKSKEENIVRVNEDKVNISCQIEDIEKQLVAKIQKLCETAYEELNIKCSQAKDKLSKDISVISDMKSELINIDAVVAENDGFDAEKKFIHLKRGQKVLFDAKQLNDDMLIQAAGNLNCKEDSPLRKEILEANSLLSIAYVEKRSYEVAEINQVSVKLQQDKSGFLISDLCETEQGYTVLADFDNKKLKIYDDKFCFVNSYCLKAHPVGVCCTGQNNIAVKLDNHTILLFNVTIGNETKTFRVRDGHLLGLGYCDNLLWLSVSEGLDVYDLSGSFIKTVKKENSLDTFQQISKDTENTLFVASCKGNRAVCYDTKSGKFQTEFRTSELQYVRGICSAPDGTVFLSGQNSNNIVMFQVDGSCMGTLLSAEQCVNKPIALMYNAQKHRLLVTSDTSELVQVIEFK